MSSRQSRTAPEIYIPEFDAIRAIGLTLVMSHHWVLPYVAEYYPNGVGRWALCIFFAISGYLITRILLASKERMVNEGSSFGHELKTFYARRFLRIFPAYYGTLLVAALVGFASVREGFLWHVSYLTNVWVLEQGSWSAAGESGHLWSLAVEEQFYLIWPLVIMLTPRAWLGRAIIGICLVGPIYRLILVGLNAPYLATGLLPFGQLDLLSGGALIAWAQLRGLSFNPKMLAVIGALAMIPVAIETSGPASDLTAGLTPLRVLANLLYAVPFVALVALVNHFSGAAAMAWMRWKPLCWIGTVSYAAYLFHSFVHAVVQRFVDNWLWAALVAYVLTLVLASASWVWFERPVHRLKRLLPYHSASSGPPLALQAKP